MELDFIVIVFYFSCYFIALFASNVFSRQDKAFSAEKIKEAFSGIKIEYNINKITF